MKKLCLLLFTLSLSVCGLCQTANSISDNYPMAVQTKISDCTSAHQLSWKGTTVIDYTEGGLSISGVARDGLPWKTMVPASGVLKCEIWSAVLRKGHDDDLLIYSSGNSGSQYDNELTVFFFDEENRPLPWSVNGGFELTSKGIKQVTTIDSDGASGIIVPQRSGDRYDGYAYVKHLYKVSPDSVSKHIEQHGSNEWPRISGNRKALTGNEATVDSYAVALPENRGELEVRHPVSAVKEVRSEDGLYMIQLSNGTKVMYPHILVLDSTLTGRVIYFDGDVSDGVDKLVGKKSEVHLMGKFCEEEECRPMTIWGRLE